MKNKLLFVFAFIYSVNMANAQVSLHPSIGGSYNTIYSFEGNNDYHKGIFGFHVGVGADISTGGDILSIEPIFRFNQRGYGFELSYDFFGPTVDESLVSRLSYLEMPVMFNFNTEVGDINLVYQIGPYIGYCIKAREIYTITSNGKTKIYDSDSEPDYMQMLVDDGFNRLDYGLIGGLRAEINSFTIGLNGAMSAQNIYGELTNSAIKQLNWQLSVGYKFEL